MWTDLNVLYTTRKVRICRFWIMKADFCYIFLSCSNEPFYKGTVHIIVRFYWSSKILSFSNDCNSGVCRLIWIIFIWKEGWESVNFGYVKLSMSITFNHGVISYFVRVPFTLTCVFSEIVKKWSFLNGCISGVYRPIQMIFISR